MITQNELRIGNIIKSYLTGEIVHTDWLVIKHISYGNYQNSYHTDQPVYEPIPITDDWLIRLGFEEPKGYGGFVIDDDYTYTLHPILTMDQCYSFYINESHETVVRYVHQLQNLYFALTGKELKLKQSIMQERKLTAVPEVGDKSKFIFTPEQKQKFVKSINDISFAAKSLVDMEGDVDVDFKNTIGSLIETYATEATDALDISGLLKKREEDKYAQIRELNKENKDLRKQLGMKVSNDDVRERIKLFKESIRRWWNIDGMGHVSEITFSEYGSCQVKLSGNVTDCYYGKSEGTYKTEERRLAEFKQAGFAFSEGGRRDNILLSTDNNIQLLKGLITDKYPSASIWNIETYFWNGDGAPVMRDITICIDDLNDILIED